ncbi:hypothetical protein G3N57_27380, partial [Paraburkholderia sp. Se-20369]|nr:hypothetical protein [Paraburkholderia sp. Se-20369]
HVAAPARIAGAGVAEAAKWFLDQLAENGRGLMLPDPSGEVVEALETLFTIRRFYRMTMGEIQGDVTLAAKAFSVNIAGNVFSRGWERHFAAPVRELDVRIELAAAPQLTPFSCFAEHIAMFDRENVALFGPQVAEFLAALDEGASAVPSSRIEPLPNQEKDDVATVVSDRA